MTRTSDLEATMEQHKVEVAATMAANAKRLDQMQEMIEKNKAETDKQHAEVLQLLKALQPPTTTSATQSAIPPPPTAAIPSTLPTTIPRPPNRITIFNRILNQKPNEGTPNLRVKVPVTRSKSDSYGDTQPNPDGSPPLEIISGGFTPTGEEAIQGKITNLSHDNLVTTTIRKREGSKKKGGGLVNGHRKLPSPLLPPRLPLLIPPGPPPLLPPSLSQLMLPPLLLPPTIIDVHCWNQSQFDFFPP